MTEPTAKETTSGKPLLRPLRHADLLSARSSRLLIVDMQEKLLAVMKYREQLIERCGWLLAAAKLLPVQVNAVEQYPRGLGPTVTELGETLGQIPDKVRFNCREALDWPTAAADDLNRDQIVVAGVEAHVCVLQTVYDLIAAGYRVYVPADAVGSRHKLDWSVSLRRMESAGATITTTESVLFEWCEQAGTPAFKEISRMVTGR